MKDEESWDHVQTGRTTRARQVAITESHFMND
jgi:hypothetical protein